MNLENKIALITGANGGLGEAIVKRLLEKNIKKIYCGVRLENSGKTLETLSDKISIIQLDLTNTKMLEENLANIENIDLLINNAGINSGKRVLDNENIDFNINLHGTLKMIQILTPKINTGGSIVNVTSVLALCNLPILGLYSASKSALHSVTQALRAEVSSKEIQVLEVLPGPIDTKMNLDDAPKASTKDVSSEIIKAIQTKEDEVYPDDFSKYVKEALKNKPKDIEKQFAQSVS